MPKLFFASLAAVTALPLLFAPVLAAVHTSQEAPAWLYLCWVPAGYGHVLSTLWFSADPDYAPIRRTYPWRMTWALVAIPLALAAVTWMSPVVSALLYALYLPWQAHHYSRQNFGLLSFAAAHEGTGKLPAEVGLMLHLTTAAGAVAMVAMPSIYPRGLPVSSLLDGQVGRIAHLASIGFLVAAAGVLIKVLLSHPRLRRAPTVLAFLILSWAFYLPALLPGAPMLAFWPYAMAHGAQYLIFMSVTSARSRFGAVGLAGLWGGALGLGAVAWMAPGPVLAQAYTGVVIWHFLADARLWRLSDPAVRQVVRDRFDFAFGARPATAAPGLAAVPVAD